MQPGICQLIRGFYFMVEGNRRDFIVAKKIISEIDAIGDFVAGMRFDDFDMDVKTQRAVSMTLIHIGELTKSFSELFI